MASQRTFRKYVHSAHPTYQQEHQTLVLQPLGKALHWMRNGRNERWDQVGYVGGPNYTMVVAIVLALIINAHRALNFPLDYIIIGCFHDVDLNLIFFAIAIVNKSYSLLTRTNKHIWFGIELGCQATLLIRQPPCVRSHCQPYIYLTIDIFRLLKKSWQKQEKWANGAAGVNDLLQLGW